MCDLPTVLEHAGFWPRAGATPGAISRMEAAFGVELPAVFSELWTFSDGMDGDGIELLRLSTVEEYAEIFAGGFGYVPFTDCNDSNPYAICCRKPLRGVIAHVFHDDQARLICRGLRRFLELVAEARRDGRDVELVAGDLAFDRLDRTAEDAMSARELVHAAEGMDRRDECRTDALRFAAQFLGFGQEDELANVLALGDEYVREAVLLRWHGLGTPTAQERLREDTAAYRDFLAKLNRLVEAAGLQTKPTGGGEFRLQPGNVGLNFAMLFADCRRSGVMEEWVRRFKERMEAK